MLSQVLKRNASRVAARCLSTEVSSAAANTEKAVLAREKFLQFSKEPLMQNFGDLELGEIPEPLKYERPMETTVISNGIRVCT